MSEFSGRKPMKQDSVEDRIKILAYWMSEREKIWTRKENSLPKPWSDDIIFQTTYFCNVYREKDKVTRYIRDGYSPYVTDPMFELNMVMNRFINWPDTLSKIGYMSSPNWSWLRNELEEIEGKVWGDAYIVSTNGRAMGKPQYLCEILLPAAYKALGPGGKLASYPSNPTLAARHKQLITVYGLGSFMAAQIIADLKNTKDHPLRTANDWLSWAAPGPGSLRGISWVNHGSSQYGRPKDFNHNLDEIRRQLSSHLDESYICNQDLQNCLCEFDKYMRIMNGVGRSKRGYNGR